MFGILTIEERPRGGVRERLKLRLCSRCRIRTGMYTERMTLFVTARVALHGGDSPARRQKYLTRALLHLKRSGAHRVVVPPEAAEAAVRLALAPVRTGAALRACIPQTVRLLMAERGLLPEQTCVVVQARKFDRSMANGVLTVAPQVRAIRLISADSEIALRESLLGDFGIACTGEAPEGTESICLCFDGEVPGAEDMSGGEGCRLALSAPPERLASMPEGAAPSEYVAALFLSGAIAGPDIRVERKVMLDMREENNII
ncbi:MAG: hypothetical protein IJU78_03350 [Clostridia bacterium]|nr:hypothetical protein [Clostridia bacterium]